jgi:class 3 adenylate cyclase
MSKKILLLEPSSTVLTLFKEKLKKTDIEVLCETSCVKFLWSLFNNVPDAIFVNSIFSNPESGEIVRFIKSMEKLRKIPIALYTTGDFTFEEFYMKNCGADLFVHIDEVNLSHNVQKTLLLSEQNVPALPVENDIMKAAITQIFLNMTRNLNSIDAVVNGFLVVIAEFAQVPAATLTLVQNDGPASYFACSKNFTEDEKADFQKVSITDFEKMRPDLNLSKIVPTELNLAVDMDNFRTKDVPLSSYQFFPINDSSGSPFAAVTVVKEGVLSNHQIDLLRYCTEQVGVLLENAVLLKKKEFFEQRIRRAFGRFVPEQIIDELVASSDTDENVSVGEKRNVAILFSDIRSFTSISECNKPEVIVAFLNRYFTVMVNIIKKHGGTIDKFIGDAIMALFGAPVSYEDNAQRAAAAAYEMREALSSVDLGDLVMPEGMKFDIGIGIHYGNVTVGSIGSSDKTDYTVIGDSVNTASRLEGLTKVYGAMIIVSETVKNDCKENSFVFRHLDDVKVKGKSKSVPIYAIDMNEDDYSISYRESYAKGLDLYQQGIWNLAKEYFEKAIDEAPSDKAAKLMLERCSEFINNPPEKWDGGFEFHTK